MPAYGDGFAAVYDTHWGEFARTVSPRVVAHLRRRRPGVELRVLDLGCGTGITAAALEEAGCVVTGLDGSPAMLAAARGRTGARTTLVCAGLAEPPPGPYDVVLCLFDTLNHLGGLTELRPVLAAAAGVTRPGATLLFDLATAEALRTWQGTTTLPGPPAVDVTARCDPDGRWAELMVSSTDDDGRRWVEVQREVSYDLAAVTAMLAETGWPTVRWTTYDDLDASLADPERVRRAVAECGRG